MTHFIWDIGKEVQNILKHGVDFTTAEQAFQDPDRIIHYDPGHSGKEDRFFCFGKIEERVLTVRFTYQENAIRIIGAGYWRRGRKVYEEKKGNRS